MKYEFKFQNILNLKEIEKDRAFSVYQNSIIKFEEAAKQLYELLKKKEKLEEFQSQQLENGFSIHEIRHYQQFIGNIEKTIEHHQMVVSNARNQMQWLEEKLKESNIEMKKYEIMKEKKYESFLQLHNERENIELDEISTVQYFHRSEIR